MWNHDRCTPIGKIGVHLLQKMKGKCMIKNDKYEAQERYDDWNTTQVKLKLNRKTDADILAWIDKQRYSRNSSIQGAIKALIRECIARKREDINGV